MDNRATPQALFKALRNHDHDYIINQVLNDPTILKTHIWGGDNLIINATRFGGVASWELITLIASLENVDKTDAELGFDYALFRAAGDDNYDAFKSLIKAGLKPNAYETHYGFVPVLKNAIQHKNSKMIALIFKASLSEDADVSLINIDVGDALTGCALVTGWNKFYSKLVLNNQLITSLKKHPGIFLLMALLMNNYEQVLTFIEYRPDILIASVNKNRFYWHAFSNERLDIINYIVEQLLCKDEYINLFQKNNLLNDALLLAVIANNIGMVKSLLAKDASVNAVSALDGDTPLHIAVKQQNAAMITLLLQHRANLSRVNAKKQTTLDLTLAKPNYFTTFKQGLSDYCRVMPLAHLQLFACRDTCQQGLVAALIKTGDSETLKNIFNKMHTTPNTAVIKNGKGLMENSMAIAKARGYIDLIVLLLNQHGTQLIDYPNFYASMQNDATTDKETQSRKDTFVQAWDIYFKQLETTGKLASELNHHPLPFLKMILMTNNVSQLKSILTVNEAILNMLIDNCSLSIHAVKNNQGSILECILENSRSSGIKEKKLSFALLHAVTNNKLDLAEKLLKANINPNLAAWDKTNDKCLHMAIKCRNTKMIALLLSYGADLSETNADGLTPKSLAMKKPSFHKAFHDGLSLYKATLASKQTMPILIQGQRQTSCLFSSLPDELLNKIGDHVRENNQPFCYTKEAKEKLTTIAIQDFISKYPLIFSNHSKEALKLYQDMQDILKSTGGNKTDQLDAAITTFMKNKFNRNKQQDGQYVQSKTTSLLLKHHLLKPDSVHKVTGGTDRYRLSNSLKCNG